MSRLRRPWRYSTLRWLPGVGLIAAVVAVWVMTSIQLASILYLLYVALSLALGVIAATTLIWMLHAWRTPDSLAESHLPRDDREPVYSFSLIIPARHEQAVLEFTLERLIQGDHPAYELVVVVGEDDRATRDVAELVAARHPQLVKIVVDDSRPKSKPKALNAALPHCTGEITGVFDAEDVVHPALLQRVDQCFQQTDADVVQAGVQLMNFRSSWLTVHNVLEYYFWFRSRLHRHARQRFIPLGGNTVFVRTSILRAVAGWDPNCLAEDCELGVRLSALGARTAVFYEPELVTREECPPTLAAFLRQRTRWNQGYLQTLSKGYWRRLPLRQRALGGYILAMPFVMAIAWLLIPVAVGTAVFLKAPVEITMMSFLPMLPMLTMLLADVVGLGEFGRAYGERVSIRDYARLVVALPAYQAALIYAAARAVARHARGISGWEKTVHFGLHLAQEVTAAGRMYLPQQIGHTLAYGIAGSGQPLAPAGVTPDNLVHPDQVQSTAFAGRSAVALPEDSHRSASLQPLPTDASAEPGNGSHTGRLRSGHLSRDEYGEPLWARLPSMPDDVLAWPPPADPWPRRIFALGSWPACGRAILDRLHGSLIGIAVPLVLVSALGVVQATNMLHWPAVMFDEGTYVGNAWAVGDRGVLAFYTYTYGHPPLAWLLITLWTSTRGIFGQGIYSLDSARELMCAVSIISFFLLFTLARRLGMGRTLAALTVILFALSPLALFFHRGVLLDNPATMWAIAAFVLARSPRRRLWSFAGSGACFGASVLSKETTLVLLPALLLAAFQNSDHRTRRYCVTLLVSFLSLMALAFPLYAALKGELIPGPGHVSLLGTDINMLFTRQGSGNVFDPHSVAHGTVTFWLSLDPWLVGVALVLSPIALAFRKTRAAAIAYLIQVLMVLRPGYLPAMYVIAMLPFAALVITGSIHQMWQLMTSDRARPGIRQGWAGWRNLASWVAGLMRPAGAAGSVVMIAAVAAIAVYVTPRWANADITATTVRLDGPQLGAEHWLLRHAGHQQRLIVTDDFWIYLIEHGFDSHPEKGGFNSPTVVSYWPLDKDPAVRRFFPYRWREFNYIVANAAMRDTAIYTPSTAQALEHSRLAAVFGKGGQRIEIRAITPTPLLSGACAAGGAHTYKVPAAGPTPSLRHVAREFRTSSNLVAVCTNRYPENPAWWNYEANHKYNAPLPPSTVVHYRRE